MKPKITPIRSVPTLDVMRASAQDFLDSIRKGECENDCWDWRGPINKKDGTAVWLFGRYTRRYRIPAHRASAFLHGLPVEDSEDIVYRTCRSLTCVNPKHLAVGDHEANVASRGRAGNTARGEKNGRAKLTELEVAEIKLMLSRGASRKALAEHYDVDKSAIRGIDNGRLWKHVAAKEAS